MYVFCGKRNVQELGINELRKEENFAILSMTFLMITEFK